MSTSFALHPDALGDLDAIRQYLAERSPDHADRVISGIFDAIRGVLVPFPKAGRRRADLTSRPLRFYVALNQYLIAYAPDEAPLWIAAVIDGRRSPRVMAAILRDRE